jgi:hypothetical protein
MNLKLVGMVEIAQLLLKMKINGFLNEPIGICPVLSCQIYDPEYI